MVDISMIASSLNANRLCATTVGVELSASKKISAISRGQNALRSCSAGIDNAATSVTNMDAALDDSESTKWVRTYPGWVPVQLSNAEFWPNSCAKPANPSSIIAVAKIPNSSG